MYSHYFTGFCPETLLKGKEVKLKLNQDDFWESPETGLVIGSFDTHATIFPWRGKGKFRKDQQDPAELAGLPYCKAPEDLSKHYKKGELIENEAEFLNYLETFKTK